MLQSLDIETLCLIIFQKYSNRFFLQRRGHFTISQLLSMKKGSEEAMPFSAEVVEDYGHTKGRGRGYGCTCFVALCFIALHRCCIFYT